MKAVMISIRPEWCELIAKGEKTIEVRKTKPFLLAPFKVYIYCTKDQHGWFDFGKKERLDGKVIGEFVCDKISIFRPKSITCDHHIRKASCVSLKKLIEYANTKNEHIYAWNISKLVIYDKPKELHEFNQCHKCEYYERCVQHEYSCAGHYKLQRPPQSWFYVEELQ